MKMYIQAKRKWFAGRQLIRVARRLSQPIPLIVGDELGRID